MTNINASINPPGVSIVICTYNGATKLPETIKHIAGQEAKGANFELIVVNNASNDDTGMVAAQCLQSTVNLDYRLIDEPEPGKSKAINKGIEAAKYEYILFCDDDNWLAPNYIQLVHEIMSGNPEIGVLGGQNIGEYESTPPAWFLQNKGVFAIGRQGAESGDITNKKGHVWGAGSVIRKTDFIWLQDLGFEYVLRSAKIAAGEDTELCLIIKWMGRRIYYDDRLVLQHYMPSSRFDYNRFKELMSIAGKVSVVNDIYRNVGRSFGSYFPEMFLASFFKFLGSAGLLWTSLLLNKNSPLRYSSERRYYYFRWRLKTMTKAGYCRSVAEKVSAFRSTLQKAL